MTTAPRVQLFAASDDSPRSGVRRRDTLAPKVAPVEGPRAAFPQTRWSRVQSAAAGDRVALSELCGAYRAPLLAEALRRTRDPQRAEDLVQGFLERFVVKNVASKVMASKDSGARKSFRAYLSTSLRNYMYSVHKAETTLSRGGGAEHVDSDDAGLAGELGTDRLFNQAWARALLDRVRARLRKEEADAGRGALVEALWDRITHEDDEATLRRTAEALGKNEGTLRANLYYLRKRYIAVLRAEVAETVDRPEDVDHELYELLSAWDEGT